MEPNLPKPISVFVRVLGATVVLSQVALGAAFVAGWVFAIRKFVFPHLDQILDASPGDRSVWFFYSIIAVSSIFGVVGLFMALNGFKEFLGMLSGRPLGPQGRRLSQAIQDTREAVSANLATTSRTLGTKPTRKKNRFFNRSVNLNQAHCQELSDGSLVMSSKNAYRKGAIALTIFTLFWDGFILFSFAGAGKSFLALTSVFLIPFVLIGIALIVGSVYLWIGALHPVIEIVLPRNVVLTGESVRVKWAFKGRAKRIQNVIFKLVGEEVARFIVGTDTQTRRHTFFERIVCEASLDPRMEQLGELEFVVPAAMPPSFEGEYNEIVWHLKFQGEARQWVDLFMSFKIPVRMGAQTK